MHSWRNFFSEIAVVVVGITIALSGEQLIEHFDDRHKASEARDGIRAEIIHNLTALHRRAATQKCIAVFGDIAADQDQEQMIWARRSKRQAMLAGATSLIPLPNSTMLKQFIVESGSCHGK